MRNEFRWIKDLRLAKQQEADRRSDIDSLVGKVERTFDLTAGKLPDVWKNDYLLCRSSSVHAMIAVERYNIVVTNEDTIPLSAEKYHFGCLWNKNCGTINRKKNCAFLFFVRCNDRDVYYVHDPERTGEIVSYVNKDLGISTFQVLIPTRFFLPLEEDDGGRRSS